MSKSNMIKRADGSYSQRGLWDNIRANKGSGKTPTKEMLKQEKKIKAKYPDGGTTGNDAGNIGMMKARMALDAHFGNPSAQRMVSPNPKIGITPEGEGTHYMVSMDNYAVPLLQDKGGEQLEYNNNPPPSREDMRFEFPENAQYFADHYKEIAPMMRNFKEYSKGGTIHIKPENKGKFNATKKATGKTTEELTHSKNPVTKKRAIFAQNAAKWKHADGGEVDPKNSFGLTGNYSRNPNSEAIESNYKLAADYQRRLGNFNTGLNANLGFNQTMPLNTEVPVMTPMIVPDANVGLNVGYDRNNSNFNGSFNYNPINQGINAEVTYRRRFAGGGETENDLIKPMVAESSGVNAPILYKPNVLTNNQRLNLPIGNPLRPASGPSSIPNTANIPQNDYQKQQLSNLNKPNIISSFSPIMKSGLHTADLPQLKMMQQFTGKEEFPSDALRRVANQHGGPLMNTAIGRGAVNALGYAGDVVLDPLNINPLGGWEAKGLKTAHKAYHALHHALDYPVKANKAIHNATSGGDSSATHHAYGGRVLPKYGLAGWLNKNKAGVGAGLGFAGDTTNLLFDNNVFGTRNKVTDSEGNELGEAQSDAGSQTQGALSGALKGASAGAVLGPWGMAGGALIGGVAGFLTADTGAEDKLNQIKRERDAQISFKNMLGKGPIENNAIQTNSLALSAYGGYINKKYAAGGMKTLNQNHPKATEEVELGESAMLPNGMNLAFGGETHENGGLETNLPEGTRIFSDRVKSGKRTIASIAKPIQNKIEKLKDNNSKAALNTVKLFENQLDNLFNEQEEIKQIEDMKQQRKYFTKGGLVKYSGEDGLPGVIEKPFMLRYNGQPNYVPTNSTETRLPFGTSQTSMMTAPMNDGTAIYNNPYLKPKDVQNQMILNQNNRNELVKTLTSKNPSSPVIVDPTSTYTDNPENTFQNTPPPSEPRFNKGDIGTAGALGTSLIGNLIQRSNLNKVAPPRTLVAPTFTAGRTPVNADYSADLQAADNQFNAARRGVMLNSGNYSTQAGNLGQLRAEQLRNRSKILQNQNNANIALMNEYQKEQADAANKNAASNYTTDQANMENLYNYNLWKTGQTNAADASAFNTSGQMFNNMVTGQNQLDAAEMYRRMYAQKVQDDLAFKNNAMGGYIPSKSEGDENWVLESRAPRNYFAKGGTVYSQKLQEQLRQPTINNAAAMDAEYASYLNKEGQPTQNTFKSKITGLDYKVLPRSEKDLYAANLWKETHNTAPTKKQVEATTKALDGKKTSSPKAKAVAEVNNSQVPQIEATLPEVTIYGKRSLNPQQMMDNKFGKPQVTNQPQEDMWGARSKDNSMWGNKKTDNSMWEREAPVKTGTQTWNKQQDVPTKPVPDWVNKANANRPNFNQVDVNEPVNEKPVVNKPKLKKETPNWLKNPLQPKFDRSEVGEPDNTGSSFNPDANESKIEKGRKYVNNTLKPAIQEFRKNLNEMDINAGVKMNMETAGKISDKGKKVTETFVKNLSNGVKYAIPTSLRVEAKDILNNQLGTNFKVTEDDFTDSQKAEILKRLNKYGIIDDYSKYEDEGMNKVSDQWNDTKNVRNSLGLFSSKQIGDTAYIKDVINYNEKQEGKVQKNYPEWYNHWNKGKNMNKWLSYPRAAASTWGSAGTDIPGGDDSKGTPVDIKLYNPKKRTLKK